MRGKDTIALRVGKVINHYNMAKHFTLEITEDSFTFSRNAQAIAAEAALDGIYVLRTSLPTDTLTDNDVVLRYKGLEDVERFFRTLNTELLLRCCGQILDCLLHVMADRPLESFAIASLQQVQNILVFLHQGIRSRVGKLQVENAHSRFGCQCVVSPD